MADIQIRHIIIFLIYLYAVYETIDGTNKLLYFYSVSIKYYRRSTINAVYIVSCLIYLYFYYVSIPKTWASNVYHENSYLGDAHDRIRSVQIIIPTSAKVFQYFIYFYENVQSKMSFRTTEYFGRIIVETYCITPPIIIMRLLL